MNAAAENAGRGFSVFPLKVGEKTPACPDHPSNRCMGTDPWCRDGHKGWEPRATTDRGRIQRAWSQKPYNVGVACGPSGLVVIDLDTHGEIPDDYRLPGISDGRDVFALICEWAEKDFPLGETYTVRTPSDGWHLYYTVPAGAEIGNSVSKIGPCVDIKTRGGYVVGAGSVTPKGTYEVLYDEPVAPLPWWIARLLAPVANATPEGQSPRTAVANATRGSGYVRKAVETECATVASTAKGGRNDQLNESAFALARFVVTGELGEADYTDVLLSAALTAGLPDSEARRTIASALSGRQRVAA